jgi:hypothetical protein
MALLFEFVIVDFLTVFAPPIFIPVLLMVCPSFFSVHGVDPVISVEVAGTVLVLVRAPLLILLPIYILASCIARQMRRR